MKKIVSLFLLCFLVITYVIPVHAATPLSEYLAPWYDSIPQMLAAGEYEEGVVIVGIDMSKAAKTGDPSSALEEKSFRAASEELMTEDISITSIRRDDMTTAQILEMLAKDDSILFAEPNYISEASDEDDLSADDAKDQENTTNAAARDMTSLQWSSSENTTFRAAGSVGNVSMNVPGWPDGSNMDHEIIVAICDDAVDFSNPDLADRAYTFSPELQAKLGCDEHGFNATWESADGKLEYYDGSDHGTHVAGIIGASWDGKGINGVGSNVRFVSVQNCTEDGKTSLVNALRGMNFIKEAKENGVDIRLTNNSWGLMQNSKALDAAVTMLGEVGIVTFFAAGNEALNLNDIHELNSTLANNPYVIIVASTDVMGQLASSSCYGLGVVTLGAPGVDILSTVRDDSYIPAMASENTFYEDFESGTSPLKIYQIDPETGEKVEGSDGVIVSAQEAMGFEGEHVLKVPVDPSYTSEIWLGSISYFRVDLSDVDGLQLSDADSIGFAYAGLDDVAVMDISEYAASDWVFGKWSHKGSWNIIDGPLDEMNIGTGPSFTIALEASAVDEVYFDTIGIGSEKHPYGFKSGTSMACPAAVGAAAVIASRHYDELTTSDAASAQILAGYIRSSVRPMASLSDKVNTGGIIDLAVDEKALDPENQPAPDITDVTVSGSEVTLTGTGFGSSAGTASIKKYVFAQESSAIASTIGEWSDTLVTLSLGEDFEGIIEAELTAANGKKDTIRKFISKSDNLFETDLSINSETGEPFTFDAPEGADPNALLMGDSESSGIMMTLDGKIYYMPQATEVEMSPVYRSLYCYDPAEDKWTAENLPALPKWIAYASGTAFDGKLYVKGNYTEVDEATGVPYFEDYEISDNICIYSFTPGDDSWQECSTAEVHIEQTLFSTDESLMLAGPFHVPGETEDDYGHMEYAVREYDPAGGSGLVKGNLPTYISNPVVTYAFGHICLCKEYGTVLYVLSDDLSSGESIEIDTPLKDPNQDPEAMPETNPTHYSIVGNEDMLVLIFSDYLNGSSADTFILKEGDTSFTPFDKRVSDAGVFGPAAAVIDGRLFVLSSSIYEPDKRLFRSTILEEPKQFTITYDLNGGNINGRTDAVTEVYEEGTEISILAAPQRDGYTFTCWKGSEYQPGDKYTVTEDHTFTAQWEKKEEAVPTGDASHPQIWIILALLSALTIVCSLALSKKRS